MDVQAGYGSECVEIAIEIALACAGLGEDGRDGLGKICGGAGFEVGLLAHAVGGEAGGALPCWAGVDAEDVGGAGAGGKGGDFGKAGGEAAGAAGSTGAGGEYGSALGVALLEQAAIEGDLGGKEVGGAGGSGQGDDG